MANVDTVITVLFDSIVTIATIVQLIVYIYTGTQIYKRPQSFLLTLWYIFTAMSIIMFVYFILFVLGPFDYYQLALWFVGTNCYTIGHFLFSYQYMMSALDIGYFLNLQSNQLSYTKSPNQKFKAKIKWICICFVILSYSVALYFVVRKAKSGAAQFGDLFTLL